MAKTPKKKGAKKISNKRPPAIKMYANQKDAYNAHEPMSRWSHAPYEGHVDSEGNLTLYRPKRLPNAPSKAKHTYGEKKQSPTQPETGTGLNVESKSKERPKISNEAKAKNTKDLAKRISGEVSNRIFSASMDREGKKSKHQEYAKSQSAQPKTEAPAFGPRKTDSNPVESLRKDTKDRSRSVKHKFAGMKASKPKGAPSFSEGMKAAKEKKAANKLMIEGATGAAKSFPGPKNEEKNIANQQMLSKLSGVAKQAKPSVASVAPPPANPYSKRTKESSEEKHKKAVGDSAYLKNAMSREKAIKGLGEGPALPKRQSNFLGNTGKAFRNQGNKARPEHKGGHARDRRLTVGESASAFKAQSPQATQAPQAKQSVISKIPRKIKGLGGAVKNAINSPVGNFGKAALTHLGMAVMHGSNYPQKMHELSQQGPRTFKPGWHGFTTPEKPHNTDATDTRGERS